MDVNDRKSFYFFGLWFDGCLKFMYLIMLVPSCLLPVYVGDSLLSSWIKFPLLIKIYIYIYIYIFPKAAIQTKKKKKKNSRKDLRLPNSLPREGLVCSFSPNLVKRTNLKTSSLSRHLANLIFSNSPQRDSINYHP